MDADQMDILIERLKNDGFNNISLYNNNLHLNWSIDTCKK